MSMLYTIGHSDLPFERFLTLIKAVGINAIADVRSSPYSRRAPWFNQRDLKHSLKSERIAYVFLGKELGGRPASPSLFREGVADYTAMARTEEFEIGVQRVLSGLGKMTIALMCSERDPLQCHRFLLVSRRLANLGVDVVHLARDGRQETHAQAEQRLLREERLDDLLASDEAQLVEAYKKRSAAAAYSLPNDVDDKKLA